MEEAIAKRPLHRRNQSSRSGILKTLIGSKSRAASPEPLGATKTPVGPTTQSLANPRGVLEERQSNVRSPPSSPAKHRTERGSKGTRVPTKTQDGGKDAVKKSKSSTNLGVVFAKMNRSSKDLSAYGQKDKDKENSTPLDPPIWAQYATPEIVDSRSNDSKPISRDSISCYNLQDEIERYTPKVYSPSKQRNFDGSLEQPCAKPSLSKDRPKSAYIAGTEGFLGSIGHQFGGRSSSDEKRGVKGTAKKDVLAQSSGVSIEQPRALQTDSTARKTSGSSTEQGPVRDNLNIVKRSGRVMAAVAAFQNKSKEQQPLERRNEPPLDAKAVDAAFEAVLESRNIPEAMRQKMRTLTLRVKVDFVKQDQGSRTISPPGSADGGLPTSKSMTIMADADVGSKIEDDDSKATKRSRTRSRTFTWSKSEKKSKAEGSPSKKQRSQSKSRPKSIEVPSDAVLEGQQMTPTTPTGSLGRKSALTAAPADYITYLRTNKEPTTIEVGRLHKLRILLRNETVAWVDSFISQDGMAEIVSLLYKIMALEWREDHEDQLLHETLLCLKGLCTTERALAELSKVADNLFPALLGMLFDEEKKGPAEYNTRAIIINILFNYLSSAINASPLELEQRARRILSYLGEQVKPEDERPVDFVIGMRVPRPYKLWCQEVSNVSKEVFWIFLHHLNVVPLPTPSSSQIDNDTDAVERAKTLQATYTRRHFPGVRPPVPAAPYIGGVEWDATSYITAHLDLMNGLIASLPRRDARNKLRHEMQASGFEKTMGAILRTCKEKFYAGVHDGLRAWVAAAAEDDWETRLVREGPTEDEIKEQAVRARSASPKKNRKKDDEPPKLEIPFLEAPKLNLNLTLSITATTENDEDGWLG